MPRRVIFIASLSHSGSTLLNLLLGAHPKLVGLGEIDSVLQIPSQKLDAEMSMLCSCGEHVSTCKFWGPTLASLQARPQATLLQKYELVFDSFEKIYGPEYQIVDSSKYLAQLDQVASVPNVALRVIHLIKDVRAYTVSQRDIIETDFKYHRLPVLFNSPAVSGWLYRHTTKSPGYLFWKWFLNNRRIEGHLAHSQMESMRMGYDELAQHPAAEMLEIYRFLEIDPPANEAFVPKRTNSHAFMGNQMLGDPTKMSEVRYDDRWRQRSDWRLSASLFPNILVYNQKMVYSKSSELSASH